MTSNFSKSYDCYSLLDDYILRAQKGHFCRLINLRNSNYRDISRDLFCLLKKCDGKSRYFLKAESDVLDVFCREGVVSKSVKSTSKFQIYDSQTELARELNLVVFYLTGRCNLSCKHCFFSHNRDMEEMSFPEWKSVITQIQKLGVSDVLLTGGEVLLREDLLEICNLLMEYKFLIRIFTNGTLLTPSRVSELLDVGISTISVSLDGASTNTHDSFRQSRSFDTILQNLRLLRKYRIEGRLSLLAVSTALTKHNLTELEDIYLLMRDIQPDVWVIERPYQCGSFKKQADELAVPIEEAEPKIAKLLERIMSEQPEFPHRIHLDKYFHWLNPGRYNDVELEKFYLSSHITGYACGNHLNHLYVFPNGDVNWCVHTDIFGGPYYNLRKHRVSQAWNHLEKFKNKLAFSKLVCDKCLYLRHCGGGCRVIPMIQNIGIDGCDMDCKYYIEKGIERGIYNFL